LILIMIEYEIRPALRQETIQIKNLINLVGINPTDLNWSRFIVAVNKYGKVIACGQIKPHKGNIIELASIAVHPEFRRMGIARGVIEILLRDAPRPVYLICMAHNRLLYERFGFHAIHGDQVPQYFSRIKRLFNIADKFRKFGEELLVMKLE
jgi:N-acetylglutamate synthase-like GNAT family acetyltransferase